MNWRRGLLLAGINVAVALPMIAMLAARDAQWLRIRQQKPVTEQTHLTPNYLSFPGARPQLVRVQEEQIVSFNPCEFWGHPPVHVAVVQSGNLPAFFLVQWRVDCPPNWSIAAMLGIDHAGLSSVHNVQAMRRVDVALCILIAAQWVVIGTFPLIKARRWWSEPGAFITLCASIGSAIALIPAIQGLGRLPATLAFFAWLWYFALLVWKPVHFAWQSTLHRRQRLSN